MQKPYHHLKNCRVQLIKTAGGGICPPDVGKGWTSLGRSLWPPPPPFFCTYSFIHLSRIFPENFVPGHLRSGHQVRSSDPTSEDVCDCRLGELGSWSWDARSLHQRDKVRGAQFKVAWIRELRSRRLGPGISKQGTLFRDPFYLKQGTLTRNWNWIGYFGYFAKKELFAKTDILPKRDQSNNGVRFVHFLNSTQS